MPEKNYSFAKQDARFLRESAAKATRRTSAKSFWCSAYFTICATEEIARVLEVVKLAQSRFRVYIAALKETAWKILPSCVERKKLYWTFEEIRTS